MGHKNIYIYIYIYIVDYILGKREKRRVDKQN
jgi:hypothetical protein